ncbi:MAG: hypothetical protein K2L02_03980 [Clostridia bacterium]|nr:hypothetical protein [Clostridia bacterium]
MKKFYGACAAVLLSLLFVFAGCKANGSKVFKYLKAEQNFVGNPTYNGGKYTASFTVKDDLSYSLSVSDEYDSALKDYSAEGTKMEYLGQRSDSGSYTSWGVTVGWTTYMHIVKLPEATVEKYGNTLAFYLLAESDSKHGDITMLKLVVKPAAYGENDIGNFEISVYGGYALKKA